MYVYVFFVYFFLFFMVLWFLWTDLMNEWWMMMIAKCQEHPFSKHDIYYCKFLMVWFHFQQTVAISQTVAVQRSATVNLWRLSVCLSHTSIVNITQISLLNSSMCLDAKFANDILRESFERDWVEVR